MTDHQGGDAVFDGHPRSTLRSHITRRLLWLTGALASGVVFGILAAMVNDGRPPLSDGTAGYVVGLTAFAIFLRIFRPTAPTFDLSKTDGGRALLDDPNSTATRGPLYDTAQALMRLYSVDSVLASAAHFVAAICWFVVAPNAQSAAVTIITVAFGLYLLFGAYEMARTAQRQWIGPDPSGFFTDTELAELNALNALHGLT